MLSPESLRNKKKKFFLRSLILLKIYFTKSFSPLLGSSPLRFALNDVKLRIEHKKFEK